MKRGIKLRIALTQACNLFCEGCFNEWQESRAPNYAKTTDLIDNVRNIMDSISSIKLTGGEPLLHNEVGVLSAMLSKVAPVSITTNGLMLEKRIVDIPQSVPITVSCYGLKKERFISYTQTSPKVYEKFVRQLQIVKNDSDREYSLNIIIGDYQDWNLYEYIEFAIRFGFNKVRFLTQLNNKSTQRLYSKNYGLLVNYLNKLGVHQKDDGDPSILYAHTGEITIELIKQYAEFGADIQNKYGFSWMNYKGELYKPAGARIFDAKGFLYVKNVR